MKHQCPVCGYNGLAYPPNHNTICPSCGTEFNYDDVLYSHEYLRQQWIENGAQWWRRSKPGPEDFDPIAQLRNIGYVITSNDRVRIVQGGIASFGQIKFNAPAYKAHSIRMSISGGTKGATRPFNPIEVQDNVLTSLGHSSHVDTPSVGHFLAA